jgi:hypothetical protein
MVSIRRTPGYGNGDQMSIIRTTTAGANEGASTALQYTVAGSGETKEQIQGVAYNALVDNANIYVFYDVGGDVTMTPHIAKFAKTLANTAGVSAVKFENAVLEPAPVYSQNGMLTWNAYSTAGIYHVGGTILPGLIIWWNQLDLSADRHSTPRRWRIAGSNTAGMAIGTGVMRRSPTHVTDHGALFYCPGVGRRGDPNSSRAPVLERVYQDQDGNSLSNLVGSDGVAFYPNVAVSSQPLWQSDGTIDINAGLYDLAFDSNSSGVAWACGSIPRFGMVGEAGEGSDGFIAKLSISGALNITKIYRFSIPQDKEYGLRFSNIEEDANHLYVSSTYLKHVNLGDNTEYQKPHSLMVMKIHKANGATSIDPLTIEWALRYNSPGLSNQVASAIGGGGLKLHVATSTLYVFGDTNLYGTYLTRDPTENNPFLIKLNIDPTTPTTNKSDTTGLFKQYDISGSVTITDITTAMTIETDKCTLVEEAAAQTTDAKSFTADTWANKKVIMNQSTLYYTSYPVADVATDAYVTPRINGTTAGTATAMWETCTNVGDHVDEYLGVGHALGQANRSGITTFTLTPQVNIAAAITNVTAYAKIDHVKGSGNDAGFYWRWRPGSSGSYYDSEASALTGSIVDPPSTSQTGGTINNTYNPNTNDYWHWSETDTTIAGIELHTAGIVYEAVGCNEYTLVWTYEMRPDPCSIKIAGVEQPRKMGGATLYDPTGTTGGHTANKVGGVNWWMYPDD